MPREAVASLSACTTKASQKRQAFLLAAIAEAILKFIDDADKGYANKNPPKLKGCYSVQIAFALD